METLINCDRCNKISSNPQFFTCGHNLCSQCTIRLIFFNHLKQFCIQENVEIKCKCKSGTINMSGTYLNKMLAYKNTPWLCVKHKASAELFCLECNNCFCQKCIETHSEINPHHNITYDKVNLIKCVHHQEQFKDLYCIDCKENICPLCTLVKGSQHSSHHHETMKEYVAKLKAEIPVHYYTDVPANIKRIEEIAKDFQRNFGTMLSGTLEKLDQLIQQLGELKAIYIRKMKQRLERAEILLNLIKYIYSEFSQWKTTQDITLLSDLSSINYYINSIDVQDESAERLQERIYELKEYFNNLSAPIYVSWSNTSWVNTVTLTGHSSYVRTLIQLKDGRIASGSVDETIKIWEPKGLEFKNTMTLIGHSNPVSSLIQLKDGRIASGSDDNTIQIWIVRARDFKNTLTLVGHTSSIYTLIQLQNELIASGSSDSTIIIWEVNQDIYRTLHTLTGHKDSVTSLLQLKDQRIASGSCDTSIKIWEMNKNSFHNTLTLIGHRRSVCSLIQLKNGLIASGSEDTTIIVWKVAKDDYKITMTLTGHKSPISSLIQVRDGRLVSASDDKTIKIWELNEKDFQNNLTLTGHLLYVITLIQLKDGRIASGSGDKTIKIWEEI